MLSRLLWRVRKNDSGVSFLEFALVLPILLAFVIGIIEFGWIFSSYVMIRGAAREGVRLAARGESEVLIDIRVEDHTQFLIDFGATIEATPTEGYPDSIPKDGMVTVTVTGEVPLLVNFFSKSASKFRIPFPNINENGSIDLSADATMRREWVEY